MKQKIAALVAVIITSVGLFSASAGAMPATSDVTGVVTKNQVAVANANVTVLCHGNTRTDMTDASGSYLVTFPAGQCPFGSTAKVTAQKGTMSGAASGTVQGITTKLNLAIVNVSIPEYGVIGSIVASLAGIGLITYSRRRQIKEQQF